MDCFSAPKYAVTLSCGAVLHYRSRAHVPEVGEHVPCLRHVHCSVTSSRAALPPTEKRRRRAPRRTRTELVQHLGRQGATTIADLRRLRFTMRLIVDTARAGLVSVSD